jgi:hypothetical protein
MTAGSFHYWGLLLALLVIIFLLYPAAVGHFGFPFEFFALISITVPFGSILFQKRLLRMKDLLQVRTVGQLYARYYQNPALLYLLWFYSFLIVCLFLGTLFSLSMSLTELFSCDGIIRRVGNQSTQLIVPLHFTILIGSIGLLTSPLFTQLSFMTRQTSLLAWQQVWGIGFSIGGLLLSLPVLIWFVAISPVFLSTTALCCILVMVVVLVRLLCDQMACDLPPSSHSSYGITQRSVFSTPLLIGLVIVVSAVFSFASGEEAIKLGWLGVALGLQMMPALIGLRFVPWFTGRAVFCGLIVGVLVVLLTDVPGFALKELFLTDFFFPSHPLQIFSGVWGVLFNLFVVIIVSAFTQSRNSFEYRVQLHDLCLDLVPIASSGGGVKLLAWILCFVWFFFAIGPGAVLGIHLFTHLDLLKVLPSPLTPFWIWCALWWGVGVTMLWLLAKKLRLSVFSNNH